MSPSDTLKILGRPIAYHPRLARLLGSVNAAILFGQLVYWSDKTKHELGIYKTAAQIEDETGLSVKEQETARKKLKEHGVLLETHKRLEHRLYFKIDFAAYDELVYKYLANIETGNTETPNDESPNNKTEIPETQKGDSGNDKSGVREATKEGFGDAQNGDSYKGALDYSIRLQHKNTENIGTGVADAPAVPSQQVKKSKQANPDNVACWQAYARAYRTRYGVLPASNQKTRGQVATLVKYVGKDIAPALAAFFLTHNGGWFVQCRHEFGCLLKSYQQVLTDMQRGEQMTQTRARQTEQTQSNYEAAKGALAKLRAKGLA